ncbi:MAG TPA: hypothetical protein VLL08_23870 [Kineosporiaceae bacterium]|nr:hypothetical protein [Kineosporiaceae bacterium]
MESASKKRAKALAEQARSKAKELLLVDEEEPDGDRGGNDTAASAQFIKKFGSTSSKSPAARLRGTLAPDAVSTSFPAPPEDNGSISQAGETGLISGSLVATAGTIGDGPHGSAGDGTGDFDYYAIRKATAGQRVTIDTDASVEHLDSIVILWDATGNAVAVNDDDDTGTSLDSKLSVALPADGDYFAMVGGFGSAPGDPFDSGSGTGIAEAGGEGAYEVTIGLDAADVDYYAVKLKAGDVLSGSATGSASRLSVYDSSVRQVFGSEQDFSGIYPMLSPLAGGGNAVVDHVVTKTGMHYLAVEGSTGDYDVVFEVYRPGPETGHATQTIFLDFDGQRVNTAIFGGRGVSTLSGLSAFLGRWAIPTAQKNALINRVIATVTENLKQDFTGTGVKIKILNSRDNADPFGRPNVSRLIIGGTIAESGVDTIGIAQSIDPGNFDTAETALVLLDVVSAPTADEPEASFNAYLTPTSDRVKFVGTALGNLASHEAGHYLGNWHVDQFNTVLNLMDQGGNFPLLYAVGPDGVGGTADDPDVDFGADTLNPYEGFSGVENTSARTRWGLTP